MIAPLGAMLSFGKLVVLAVLQYVKQNQANKQELAMLESAAKYASWLSELRVAGPGAQEEIAETAGLYAHDQSLDSGDLVNALRRSVRLSAAAADWDRGHKARQMGPAARFFVRIRVPGNPP